MRPPEPWPRDIVEEDGGWGWPHWVVVAFMTLVALDWVFRFGLVDW